MAGKSGRSKTQPGRESLEPRGPEVSGQTVKRESEITVEGGPRTEDPPRSGDWAHRSSSARGRRRPDESLAQDIHEILTSDPELDATDIKVEVEDGAVTLSGVVDSLDAKLLAEELVESLVGVREVHNGLRVTREE